MFGALVISQLQIQVALTSLNIIGGSHYLCQEPIFWLREGDRMERKKERQDSLVCRLGITIEFLTKSPMN
jgi:hypothetical protein